MHDQVRVITMYPWEGHVFRRPPFTTSPEKEAEGIFSIFQTSYLVAIMSQKQNGQMFVFELILSERNLPVRPSQLKPLLELVQWIFW